MIKTEKARGIATCLARGRQNGAVNNYVCDGFTVFIPLIAGSRSIRLSDDAADETIAMRREEVSAAEARVIADKITKLY